jgi:iron complex transport system ATP-binding protein
MENKIILQASQISIGYSHKKKQTIVASDISISKKGKLIALIGANGIGKSTL